MKGLAKFSSCCGRRTPGERRRIPQRRSAGQSRQAGYGPGAPAAPEVPRPLQAGARESPHLPARLWPAAPRRRRPLTEPGAPGGGRNKEPRFLPRTVGVSSHSREGSALSRTRPARVLPAPPGHGELRAAAAALGLLRGGRRTEWSSWSEFPL